MSVRATASQHASGQRADPHRTRTTHGVQAPVSRRSGVNRIQAAAGNRTIHRMLNAPAIQPKLTVGPVDDEYEREAERVADRGMRMPDPPPAPKEGHVQRACNHCEEEKARRAPIAIQRMCTECEKETQDTGGDGGVIQAKRAGINPPDTLPELSAYVQSSRHDGQPLPQGMRDNFEARFGHDFGGVRVHTGTRAAEAAAQINALAFTTGSDIYFGSGRFNPGTPEGDRLLAHELTHVVQQTSIKGSTVQQHATRMIQRLGDVSKRPAALDSRCPLPPGSPHPVGEVVEFGNRVTVLSPLDEARIENVVRNWHAAGGTQTVRVDGFASHPDSDELNWELSCARAEAVVAELTSPSGGGPGIDRSAIVVFAHGETGEFGAEAHNRRATITLSGGTVPPPTPTPEPTPTPGPSPAPSTPPATPSCAVQPGCPADFCRPFPTRAEAEELRDSAQMSAILVTVAALIDPAVHSLWNTYLHGGSSEITLGPRFQFEFGRSIITALTTDFLVSSAADVLRTTPGLVPPGAASATFDLRTLIPAALADIDTPGGSHEMDFSLPLTIEGNIAGAVGKDQTSCRIGATPSPRNDERLASGTIELTQLFGRTYFLTPNIEFTVIDTIDLCPGGCGAPAEQIATVPLSRLEASGVSGDVPIRVTFPASLNRRIVDVP